MADSPMSARGCDDPQLYEPLPSLWHHITSVASHHELSEIKNLLGESLVEQSLELHGEVGTLLDIWRDCKQTARPKPKPRLPEPPAQRELLRAEIKFFIDSIHEKAKANGRDPDAILSRHNSQIMDYVLDDSSRTSCSSRSSVDSPSWRSGRETPSVRSSSRCDSVLTLDDVRATLNGKTVFQYDDVVLHLREVLEKEIGDLIENIDFLQNCLEEEVDSRSESQLEREPTLFELREERTNLEKELLSADCAVPTVLQDSTNSVCLIQESSNISSPARQRKNDGIIPVAARSTSDKFDSPINTRRAAAVKAFPDETVVASMQQLHLSRNGASSSALPAVSNVSAQSLRRLVRSSSPNHVIVRTGQAVPRAKGATAVGAAAGTQVVHVARIPADAVLGRLPVPPSASRPSPRPSSAQRFRNMVLDCRDGK